MSLVLRIDTDYSYRPSSMLRRGLYVLRNDFESLVPPFPRLGYLQDAASLFADLRSRGVAATFFFMRSTTPTKPLAHEMLSSGQEIGLHAHRTREIHSFCRDLESVRASVSPASIGGFSKHGSGKLRLGLRHSPEYNKDQLVGLALAAGLRYFSGNGVDPALAPYQDRGVVVFPSAFWMNPARRAAGFDIEWLIDECGQRDVVCLLHPYEYAVNRLVGDAFERIMGSVDRFAVFGEALMVGDSPGPLGPSEGSSQQQAGGDPE